MSVYKVTTPTGVRLVDAKTAAAAINHVTKPGVTAEPLTASELAAILRENPEAIIETVEGKINTAG